MGRRLHAKQLALYMNGEMVGHWKTTAAGEQLQYAQSWHESPRRRPISIRFPLTPDFRPYSGPEVHDFFENLLPDSKAIRERLAKRFNTGSTGAFRLLTELGRDCVGALQILPEGEEPKDVRSIHAAPLNDTEIAQILRDTVAGIGPALTRERDEDNFRISIAGAQEKTALLWNDREWCRPIGATPTTHILKLPLGMVGGKVIREGLTTSVENEWICSKILSAFDIRVAHCDMQTFEDQKVLVVQRFDRRLSSDGKWLVRLPQEDMCQATGTSYLRKYQQDGGPGIDQIMNLLRTSERALEDRKAFFKCQLIFWLLAAIDGHAKNFSLYLEEGGKYSLTPIYDVLSAYPFMGEGANFLSPHKAQLAMGVKGKNMHYHLNEISRRHWNITAERNGLSNGGEDIIQDVIENTPKVIAAVSVQLPKNFPEVVFQTIFKGMQEAANKLSESTRLIKARDVTEKF